MTANRFATIQNNDPDVCPVVTAIQDRNERGEVRRFPSLDFDAFTIVTLTSSPVSARLSDPAGLFY